MKRRRVVNHETEREQHVKRRCEPHLNLGEGLLEKPPRRRGLRCEHSEYRAPLAPQRHRLREQEELLLERRDKLGEARPQRSRGVHFATVQPRVQ